MSTPPEQTIAVREFPQSPLAVACPYCLAEAGELCGEFDGMHQMRQRRARLAPVIASPAYQLPEVASDADHFATAYIAEQNAVGAGIPGWMHPHLAWMWLMGEQKGRGR